MKLITLALIGASAFCQGTAPGVSCESLAKLDLPEVTITLAQPWLRVSSKIRGQLQAGPWDLFLTVTAHPPADRHGECVDPLAKRMQA